MVPTKLDHCVIHVSDWERSNKFYEKVIGAELVQRPHGWAYRLGDKQLNVHGPGVSLPRLRACRFSPATATCVSNGRGPSTTQLRTLKNTALP